MSPFNSAKAALSVKINQIAALIKVSILNATHRGSVRSAVGAHAGTAAAEAELARTGTNNRTAPIFAEVADTADAERTTDEVAGTSQRQFKRGGKSTHRCIYTPIEAFCL